MGHSKLTKDQQIIIVIFKHLTELPIEIRIRILLRKKLLEIVIELRNWLENTSRTQSNPANPRAKNELDFRNI